ncbi:MAG: tRNA (adenosine(37)-N6)-threonylcarbamoyltransferase complex ATPase subunit type 1 TsaE [Candidatus Bipolaricaulota bacterium]|nr:tRNA (adenosine(37)-N6)-threonylcarbamoyltransferase complex ATPase subunit type 1 TsaE [Candidatus Bipolaricaulota bacterium]
MPDLTPGPLPTSQGGEFVSTNADETRRFAAQLVSELQPGDCVLLIGELGVGKTTFVQGLAQGLGITEPVRSPTFVLMHEYHGRISLYHFDAYRIKNLDELREIGFEDTVRSPGITVIEWGEKTEKLLPWGCWRVSIELLPNQMRRIRVERPQLPKT